MKRLAGLAGLAGLALAIAIVAAQGWPALREAFERAGLALLWIVPFHALPLLLDSAGWRVLLAQREPGRRVGVPALFWIAAVREAISRLLPVASIGGEIVGVRLATWFGIEGTTAAASVIVEVLLTLVNQYLFTALGIVLLLASTRHADALGMLMTALGLGLPIPIALYLLLRHGRPFSWLESVAQRLLGAGSRLAELIDGTRLDAEVRALCSRAWRLAAACGWQLLGFIAGSFECWFTLRLIGHPIDAGAAIAIESLTQALRHLAFIVPAGLGIQEGGLVLFGALIGLPADASVALSLAKRLREIGFGLPALISWQWAEARRLHRRAPGGTTASGNR